MALKKPKKPEAPKAPAGGVMAPKSAAKAPSTGLSRAQNLNPLGGGVQNVPNLSKSSGNSGPGSGSTAAAPAPAPGVRAPAPESPATHNARTDAKNAYHRAQENNAYAKYAAAIKVGDLVAANRFGKEYADLTDQGWNNLTNVDTGEYQEIARQEAANQLRNKLGHVENNTFRSGMNLLDIGNIEGEADRARTKAKQDFDEAVHNLEIAEAEALEARNIAFREAHETDEREYLKSLAQGTEGSQDSGASGGGGGSTITSFSGPTLARAFSPQRVSGNMALTGNPLVGQAQDLSKKKKK